MTRWTMQNILALGLFAHAACGMAACSDDADEAPGKARADGRDSGAREDRDAAAEQDPVYVVHSTIDTDDVRVGYLVTTPSIEGDVEVDVTRGIEVPGGGYLYAPPQGGYVLLGASEEPTFTRYELDDDGNLQEGKTVSFANLGTSYTYRHVIFVSDEQAYFLDESQLQIIRFNPTSMELDHAIPVDDFRCEESSTNFGTPIRRADGFYFPRGCWDLDITSSGTSLVHLDPKTDEVTVTQEDRCMGLQIGFVADSGDAYWFSDHDASVEWTFQRRDTPHDCALRLRADEDTFDQDWALDLTTRTGGVSAVAAVPAGGSKIWVKVFEASAFEGEVPVDEIDWGIEAWRWGRLDVESDAPVELDQSSDLVVSYGYPIAVGERASSPVANADYTASTLTELTAAGVVECMHVQGELRKIFKLR